MRATTAPTATWATAAGQIASGRSTITATAAAIGSTIRTKYAVLLVA